MISDDFQFFTTDFERFVDDMNAWKGKPVNQWDNLDVCMWVTNYSRTQNLNTLQPQNFADLNGEMLSQMGIDEYQRRDSLHGTDLFIAINNLFHRDDTYYRSFVQPPPPEVLEQNNNYSGKLVLYEYKQSSCYLLITFDRTIQFVISIFILMILYCQ